MPFLLRLVAAEERRRRVDLSERLIVIEPADPEFSIGLNVLEAQDGQQNYVQLAEFAQILKARWNLDSFGARTEELLRNSLHVLADNGLDAAGTFAAADQRRIPRGLPQPGSEHRSLRLLPHPLRYPQRSRAGSLPRRHPQ